MEMRMKEDGGKVSLVIVASNEAEKMVLRDIYKKGEVHNFKLQVQARELPARG